ncbi:hypothetical protein LguiA_018744 [Lonicera macranthoides]
MAITQLIKSRQQEDEDQLNDETKRLLISLPKEKGWRTPNLYLYQTFWCQPKEIQSIISFQRNFKSQPSDIILATIPKSGTTWLKALAYAIVNRESISPYQQNHPLLTSNPHELVPFLEYKVYANDPNPNLSNIPSPRLFATHLPFGSLPESVSGSRIVYICRNPLDTFVSIWHYVIKLRPENLGPLSFEEAFDMYCRGVTGFGPYWDHMLGYWEESKSRPNNVMFLKYEDMKGNICFHLKKLGIFLGCPFSIEEEKAGVIEEIAKLCSFDNLKELDVNKNGKAAIADFENKHLFRKGEVGDWVNYLSPWMAERLSNVMEEKLGGSGLTFKVLGD